MIKDLRLILKRQEAGGGLGKVNEIAGKNAEQEHREASDGQPCPQHSG